MRCQLCGFEFDETRMSCHSSCAFNKSCVVICCPNCGYQWADASKSRLANAFRGIWERKRSQSDRNDPAVCRLSALRAGQSARVVSLESANASRLERLSVFGLVPGMHITLEQRHPAFVLRVGFTELSLEKAVADEIIVQPILSAG